MKRKNRLISIVLVVMMLLSLIPSGLLTAYAANEPGDSGIDSAAAIDTSSLDEINIYWTRSKEWMKGELPKYTDVDENDNVLTLRANTTYKLSDLLRGIDGYQEGYVAGDESTYRKDIFYDGNSIQNPGGVNTDEREVAYKYSALNIAYADPELKQNSNLDKLEGTLGAQLIKAAFAEDTKDEKAFEGGIKYDLKAVWDGGYHTNTNGTLKKLRFEDSDTGVYYEYDYLQSFYQSVTRAEYMGRYQVGATYTTGDIVKCSDDNYYRYIGVKPTTAAPVIGSPVGEGAQLYNGWEHMAVREADINGDTSDLYDARMGIYHFDDEDRFHRWGNESNQGEWCTWLTHTESDYWGERRATTARRFTGYFYLPEGTNTDELYLALADGSPMIVADDSVDIFINGHALFRASTNDSADIGYGEKDYKLIGNDGSEFVWEGKDNEANTNLVSYKNGWDYNYASYTPRHCNEAYGTGACVVQKVPSTGTPGTWDEETIKQWQAETVEQLKATDPELSAKVAAMSVPVYAEAYLYNKNYAFAAYWHVHTDKAAVDIAPYVRPGQANRIDIIACDYDDGGGMSRMHLFSSGKVVKSAEIGVKVNGYVDNKDGGNPFDEQVSPVINEDGVMEKDAVKQPVETTVYYEYIVTNPPNSNPLYNVEVVDDRLNIKLTPNGIYEKDENGNWKTTPVTEGFKVWDKDGNETTLSNLLGQLASGESVTIRTDYAKTNDFPTPGKYQTMVSATGATKQDNPTDEDYVTAKNSTYVLMYNNMNNDWVVVDFGLPVTLDVLTNDYEGDNVNGVLKNLGSWNRRRLPDSEEEVIATGSVLDGLLDAANVSEGKTEILTNAGVTFKPATENTYGDYGYMLQSKNDSKSVTYVPTKFINGEDVFIYNSLEDGKNNRFASVTVVPATNVYYEDNFNSNDAKDPNAEGGVPAIVYSGNWSIVDKDRNELDNTGSSTTGDREQSNDNSSAGDDNDNYGYDDKYDSDKYFSFGTAHEVGDTEVNPSLTFEEYRKQNPDKTYFDYLTYQTANMNKDFATEKQATVQFKFRGTGFDIISYTNNTSGILNCKVEGMGEENAGFSRDLKVSNYYEVPGKTLYQVPVIAVKDLAYGDYKVTLTVDGNRALGSKGNIVVIDGIRVYNPLGGPNDYYTGKEKNTTVYEIRDLLRGKKSNNNNDIGGNRMALFGVENDFYYVGSNDDGALDEYGKPITSAPDGVDLERYNMDGPKNELYVTSIGTGITFKYQPSAAAIRDQVPLTMQIEAKTLNAASGITVRCHFLKAHTNAEGEVDEANVITDTDGYYKEAKRVISTSTQMFYDFSDLLPEIPQNCIFEITKSGEASTDIDPDEKIEEDLGHSKGSILSLSTVKVTEGTAISNQVNSHDPVVPIATGIAFDHDSMSIPLDGMSTARVVVTYSDGTTKSPAEAGIEVDVKEVKLKDGTILKDVAYNAESGVVTFSGAKIGSTTLVASTTGAEFARTATLPVDVTPTAEGGIVGIAYLVNGNPETQKHIDLYNNDNERKFVVTLIRKDAQGNNEYVLPSTVGAKVEFTAINNYFLDASYDNNILTIKTNGVGNSADLKVTCGNFSADLIVSTQAVPETGLHPVEINLVAPNSTVLKYGDNLIDISKSEVVFGDDNYFDTNEYHDTVTKSLKEAASDLATSADYSYEVNVEEDENKQPIYETRTGSLVTSITPDGFLKVTVPEGLELKDLFIPVKVKCSKDGCDVNATVPATFSYAPVTGVTLSPAVRYAIAGQTVSINAVISPVTSPYNTTWEYTQTDLNGITIDQTGTAFKVTVPSDFKPATGKCVTIDNIKAQAGGINSEVGKVKVYDVTQAVKYKDQQSWPTDEVVEHNGKYFVTIHGGASGAPEEGKDGWQYIADVPVEVQSIGIDAQYNKVAVGYTIKLNAIIKTSGSAPNLDKVTWSSSNPEIATIDQNGVVRGVAKGTTTITLTSVYDPNFSASMLIEVIDAIPVEGVVITGPKKVSPGGKITLTASVLPADAADKSVTWSSEDDAIATVDQNGVVTGVTEGSVEIQATSNNGKIATYTVNVRQFTGTVTIKPTYLEGSKYITYGFGVSDSGQTTKAFGESVTINQGKTYFVFSTKNAGQWQPYIGTEQEPSGVIEITVSDAGEVSWRDVICTNTNPVTFVDANTNYGKMEEQPDESYILSWTEGVGPVAVTGVTVTPNGTELTGAGETFQFTATVQPANATNQTVTWKSSNEGVAIVDEETGLVTSVGPGTADIIATTEDGRFTAFGRVTVKSVALQNVTLDPNNLEMFVGNPQQIKMVLNPSNATVNGNAIWASNNAAVATVDENGNVTPVGVGTAEITVTVDGKTATAQVTVKPRPLPESIAIWGAAEGEDNFVLDVSLTQPHKIGAVVSPSTAVQIVTWNSSNTDVATIDDEGNITVKAVGDTVITATSTAAPDVSKSVTLHVVKHVAVEGISIDQAPAVSIDLDDETDHTIQLNVTFTPADATNKNLTWESSNDEKVSVDGSGKITAWQATGSTPVIITAKAEDGGYTATVAVTVTSAAAFDGTAYITPDLTGTYKYGAWVTSMNVGWNAPTFSTSFEEKAYTAGTYYFVFSSTDQVYNANTWANVVKGVEITVTSDEVKCRDLVAKNNGGAFILDYAGTEYAKLEPAGDPGHFKLVWNESPVAPANALLIGTGSPVIGVAEDGKVTDIDTAAAYSMLTDAGVTPKVVASLGYSLVEKEGYVKLEDAVKSLVREGDNSEVVVLSLNDTVTNSDSTSDLINAMESLLNTVHTLSPNAKILLVASRGAYTRYMEDAVKAADLASIVSFMEDTSSALTGAQAVVEQEELTNLIAAEVARILSLDEVTDVQTDSWTAITVYNAGDVVVYNGTKYECVTAHVAKNNSYNPEELPGYWKKIA